MFNKIMCFWRERANKKECWKKETGALYEQQFFSLFVPTLTNISLHITECDDEPRWWQRESTQMSRWGDIEELAKEVTRGGQGSLSTTVGYRTTDRLVMSHCGLVTLSKRLISTPAGYRDTLQCNWKGTLSTHLLQGYKELPRTHNTLQYHAILLCALPATHAISRKVLQGSAIP